MPPIDSPIDLTRDVRDAKDTKDVSQLFADLELLHNDKRALKSKVDATNEANKELIEKKIIPELIITDQNGCEKVTFGDHCVKFMKDGSQIEYSDDRFPLNATKIIRKDGSKSEIQWVSETAIGVVLNTDMFENQTKIEAKDGVKIECDNATGKNYHDKC